MIQFQCDYNEGAHPKVMQRLLETNMTQCVGYGEDEFCQEARKTIKRLCGTPDADVHFLVGGTQTNATVISAALRPYQAVICATSGHINVHETGAIEHTGHKVIGLPAEQGKISAEQIEKCVRDHYAEDGPEHMAQPAMVYISMSTEVGTIYSHKELHAIKEVCERNGLILFVDGARLGYALASPECDITLRQLACMADVFYLGGTKQGLLFGEALVINDDVLKKDFRYSIKQNGGMLAKGRLLGVQFQAILEDGLYFDLAAHADALAMRIRAALLAKGYAMPYSSPTNQQFVVLPDEVYAALSKDFLLSYQCKPDAFSTLVRICTSWATTDEAVDKLVAAIEGC